MQKTLTIILAVTCTIHTSSILRAMDQGNHLKRDRTEPVPATSSRAEKKEKLTVSTPVLRWQEALIEGANEATSTPLEVIEHKIIEVDPIVTVIYHDDLERLKHILEIETPNLFCRTSNIIDDLLQSTLLDIAVARKSVKCLTYFRELLTTKPPEIKLEGLVCNVIAQQCSSASLQNHVPHIDITSHAASGQFCTIYYKTIFSLRKLYEIFGPKAYNATKIYGDIKLARLLAPLPKKK